MTFHRYHSLPRTLIIGALGVGLCAAFPWSLWRFTGPVDITSVSNARISGSASSRLGASMTHGDFDGDGDVDVAIAAPAASSSAVFVFFGPLAAGTLDVTQADVEIYGPADSAMGWKLGRGQLIGGSEDDLVISAPSANGGEGAIYVFDGGGLDTSTPMSEAQADVTIDGQSGGELGRGLAVGDFDGDGVDEIAAGEPSPTATPGEAHTYLFDAVSPGSITADPTDPSLIVFTGSANRFGEQVQAVGDMNGDHREELVISDHGVFSWSGAVYVVYGAASFAPAYDLRDPLMPPAGVFTAVGSPSLGGGFSRGLVANSFGFAVTGLDINADGFSDLVVGSPSTDRTACHTSINCGGESRINIILGASNLPLTGANDADTISAAVLESGGSGHFLGTTLANGLDLDLDGAQDLLIGTLDDEGHVLFGEYRIQSGPQYVCEGWGSEDGLTCRYVGSTNPLSYAGVRDFFSLTNTITYSDPGSLGAFGRNLEPAWDIDGDGVPDILIADTVQAEAGDDASSSEPRVWVTPAAR